MFGPNKRIDVYWQVNASVKKVHPRVKGAKLYIKSSEGQDLNAGGGLSSDYHLISEMSFELGSRSPAKLVCTASTNLPVLPRLPFNNEKNGILVKFLICVTGDKTVLEY